MELIFDRNKLKLHRSNTSIFQNNNFLRQHAANIIVQRLGLLNPSSGKVIEIGAGIGELTKKILHFDLTVTEVSPELLRLNPCLKQINIDDENLELGDKAWNVVLSCLNLHWINDVKLFLRKIYLSLKPGGVFIANFIGGHSLKSLRKKLVELEINLGLPARPHISPFILKEDVMGLMQSVGFTAIIVESDSLETEYSNCLALMKDLKQMGESNKLIKASGQTLGKNLYLSLLESNEKFITEFEIINVCGKK
jgi:SAM-dependent methyltransferase